MEYAQFVETVGKIDSPNNVDEVYGSLMSNEANTLRIIERVAADTRRDTISSNDIWNMSIKRVLDEFITFWISSYVHVMKQETTSWFKSFGLRLGCFTSDSLCSLFLQSFWS
jgi:trans-aconitate methyltransferase